MFAVTENIESTVSSSHVIHSIVNHSAWYGEIEGLRAEKLVRGKVPFTYLLRQGEPSSTDEVTNYYVTFVLADGTVRHQPFVITLAPEGWHAENYGSCGPFQFGGIELAIHKIMHCEKEQLIALKS